MEVLSDKLTSRCVTSYLSCIGDKQNKLLCNKSLCYKLQLRLSASLGRTMSPTEGLKHKQNSHCVTNYAGTIWQTK